MNFLILILLVCFFIFLYIIYLLSHDDFIILRRDVSMEKVFNAAFLFAIFGIFVSRLVYVIFHPNPVFHSLLGFILFPYFPGLSLIGGLIGGFGFSYLYFKSRNLPVGRLMDFFSMAFLTSYPVGLLGTMILSGRIRFWFLLLPIVLSAIILAVFVKFVLPLTLGGKLKDGVLSLIFFSSFCFVYILTNFFVSSLRLDFNTENIISFIIFAMSLIVLAKEEKLLGKYFPKK